MFFGRAEEVLERRKKIKQRTLNERRAQAKKRIQEYNYVRGKKELKPRKVSLNLKHIYASNLLKTYKQYHAIIEILI